MKIMNKIREFIFGVRAQGEPVPPPSLKTTEPTNRPTENVWFKEMKFGSRYGHRGSFYQKKSIK